MPAEPSPRVEPIGTRLIDSTPPATTTSAWPLITVAAAKATACWEEPHCRSIVVPGTVSGQPAASGALRPMLKVCSPTWLTQPQNTSSTIAGSMPDRSASAVRTCAERSTACTPDSPPPRLPTGVRTAAQMTASRMDELPSRDGYLGGRPTAPEPMVWLARALAGWGGAVVPPNRRDGGAGGAGPRPGPGCRLPRRGRSGP